MVKPSKEAMSKTGKSNARRGKTLERRVARLFTKWTGNEFRRRRVEGRDSNVIERESTADIIPVSRQSIFSIEVKNATGFSLDALMNTPTTTKFVSWWHQASYDASLMTNFLKRKIHPFLFFKPIPSWDWVVFPINAAKILRPSNNTMLDIHKEYGIWFPALRFDAFDWIGPISHNISQSKENPIIIPLKLEACYICRWNDFTTNVDPDSLFF